MFSRVAGMLTGPSILTGLISALVLMIGLAQTGPVSAQSSENYVIQSGDVLQIEVLEDPSLNRSALVLPDGSISFPMAGTVPAKGRSVDQVRQNLSAALASNFASSPNVFVSIAALAPPAAPRGNGSTRTIDVFALGEFEQPGRKEVKPGITLLQFLAEAGGLSRFAAEKRIELHRTEPKTGKVTTYLFNYRTPGGGSSGINGGTMLAEGDVVKVPQRRLFE